MPSWKPARRAFAEAGDVNGTKIRVIAEKAGVSECLSYRHSASKEQLFVAAVLEPLQHRVDKLLAASEVVDCAEPLIARRQKETMEILFRQLATFTEVLPLLGLVLFSDPAIAQKFYRENFSVALIRRAAGPDMTGTPLCPVPRLDEGSRDCESD